MISSMAHHLHSVVRCDGCHDVIGTYEPLVVVASGRAHQTSYASEPELCAQSDAHFHRSCYEAHTEPFDERQG
jgi:hypothetical protein